jgi:hypothetical protein
MLVATCNITLSIQVNCRLKAAGALTMQAFVIILYEQAQTSYDFGLLG